MSEEQIFVIPPQLRGKRLDSALAEAFPQLTRSFFLTLIKGESLTVDHRRVKAGFKLKGGETARFTIPDLDENRVITPTPLTFSILYEDDHIIAIDKPVGLVVHPGAGRERVTVVSALLSHTVLSPVGAPTRPGIVHRLDKETSGVMVLAKTEAAHRGLVRIFSRRKARKIYLAIVQGQISNDRGRIEMAIQRDPTHRKKMQPTTAKLGKGATTRFRVLRLMDRTSLIKARIQTGRTHQIRVHFSAIGHPLLGDRLYGGRPFPGRTHHFLHARHLSFRHPITGEKVSLTAPIPREFLDACRSVGWRRD